MIATVKGKRAKYIMIVAVIYIYHRTEQFPVGNSAPDI